MTNSKEVNLILFDRCSCVMMYREKDTPRIGFPHITMPLLCNKLIGYYSDLLAPFFATKYLYQRDQVAFLQNRQHIKVVDKKEFAAVAIYIGDRSNLGGIQKPDNIASYGWFSLFSLPYLRKLAYNDYFYILETEDELIIRLVKLIQRSDKYWSPRDTQYHQINLL